MPDRITDDVDPANFFSAGESFMYTSALIYYTGMHNYGPSIRAVVVIQAFGAEAYLKALAQIESGLNPLETHNLRELFRDLSPATQKAARRLWLKRYGQHELVHPKDKWLKLKLPDGEEVTFKRPTTFEEALDLSAEAFVKWRYDFEEPRGWHLNGLAKIAREFILIAKPEWRPESGNPLARLNPHPDFVKPKLEKPGVTAPGGPKFNYQSTPIKFQMRHGPYSKDGRTG